MEPTYPTRLKITKLPNNIFVMKQLDGNDYFIASNSTLVISQRNLTNILNFLVCNNLLDHHILEGILEEHNSYGKRIDRHD